MPGLYENPCVISRVLYLMILFFLILILHKYNLYPTSFTPLGVWTTSPKTLHFASEFNSV